MQIFQRFLSKQILRPAVKGQGLAFLIFFLLSTLLMASTLRIMTNSAQPQSLHAYQDRFIANTIFTTAFETVREDILSKLNSGTTVDTTYTYPSPVNPPANATTPHDPTALNGTQDTIGTWSATMLYARGNTYTVQVTVSAGGANVSQTQLMQLIGQPPAFSCSSVTNSIQAGNISTVSDSYLTQYAQNNCMLITAIPPSAPTTSDGATACNTNHAGAGTLQLTSSLNCGEVVNGTYDTVYLHSGTALSGTFTSASSNARTIHIPGTVASNKVLTFSGTGAQTVLFADADILNKDTIDASGASGNNIFRLNDIYEVLTTSSITWNTGTGNSQLYLQKAYTSAGGAGGGTAMTTITATSGNNQFYIDNMTTDKNDGGTAQMKVMITGGSGNDTISCNGTLGTVPVCTIESHQGGGMGSGVITIDGGAGNNIISLNTLLVSNLDGGMGNATTTVYGGTNASYNIIYAQGCTTTTGGGMGTPSVTINPGGSPNGAGTSSGKNLVIVNNLAHCTFSGQTSSDVLLYHTGTPPGSFGRTLTY